MTSLKSRIVSELFRGARKNFSRRKVELRGLDDLMQIDLIDVSSLSKSNRGMKFILVAINALSKVGFAEGLKDKRGPTVTAAMKKILERCGTKFKNVSSDDGGEFWNASFKKLMSDHKINHYSTFSSKKASIVERWIRTLKMAMYKNFQIQGSFDWANNLQKLVDDYNNKVHSTTGMKPSSVRKKHESFLLNKTGNSKSSRYKSVGQAGYRIGDYVRVSKYKHVFAKSYIPSWSAEIFVICKIIKSRSGPPIFYLNDLNKKPILGGFYKEELQKTKLVDDYLIEKILQRRGDQILVKWLGFKDPTWAKVSDVH